ncbi:MAG TPA: Gfo/Idh/MocA family oxidoreductase [Pseudonocardiaceae bacterium]|nr:Gfo/Idh/MocA family oxidoreductase [Pseudonocardiaceae bacterium]
MTRTPIRVAVVGLGWAARSIWLPRLLARPAFTVAAVVDPNPLARASAARDGLPSLARYEDLRADDVDLAVVAVPNHLHTAVACGLLRNGISVFVEKPVCLNSAEVEDLAAAEQSTGATLLAGSAARHRADMRVLYGLAETIGQVRHVDVSWVRARGIPDAGGWFTDRRFSGGGALVDLGWHLMDAVGPFIGTSRFDHVVGTASRDFINAGSWRAAWRADDELDGALTVHGDVEDTARAFLVAENGVSVSLCTRWASHEPRDTTVITIEGTAGAATLNCTFGFSPNRAGDPVVTHTRDGDTIALPVPDEPIGAEYDRQLAELPALLAEQAVAPNMIDNVRGTVAVVERIYESAGLRRGARRPVEVASP